MDTETIYFVLMSVGGFVLGAILIFAIMGAEEELFLYQKELDEWREEQDRDNG